MPSNVHLLQVFLLCQSAPPDLHQQRFVQVEELVYPEIFLCIEVCNELFRFLEACRVENLPSPQVCSCCTVGFYDVLAGVVRYQGNDIGRVVDLEESISYRFSGYVADVVGVQDLIR